MAVSSRVEGKLKNSPHRGKDAREEGGAGWVGTRGRLHVMLTAGPHDAHGPGRRRPSLPGQVP